ncbi:MAG: UTP--glucose-1-phosphate uridylyltransferase [Chlamydiales bacterium]
MPRDDLETLLKPYGQQHLLAFWNRLDTSQRSLLENEILRIDWNEFNKQKELLKNGEHHLTGVHPVKHPPRQPNSEIMAYGNRMLKAGKVGSLMVAGGQGTRLGFNGPKGKYPLLYDGTTLFELFARKIQQATEKWGYLFPLAIMTSPLNHEETVEFFNKHGNFGLRNEQLFFFRQNVTPFLNETKDMFLETPCTIAQGPGGNGEAISLLFKEGIAEKWKQRGIEYIVFFQVDNALIDPLNSALIGMTSLHNLDVGIVCIERENPLEKLGVLVEESGKIVVREYSELSEETMQSRDASGLMKYRWGNISHFCFSLSFMQQVYENYERTFPLHKAFKQAPYLNQNLETIMPSHPNAWKFERFIFDLLPSSNKTDLIVFPREAIYAPLKNREGTYSPGWVRGLLN